MNSMVTDEDIIRIHDVLVADVKGSISLKLEEREKRREVLHAFEFLLNKYRGL